MHYQNEIFEKFQIKQSVKSLTASDFNQVQIVPLHCL